MEVGIDVGGTHTRIRVDSDGQSDEVAVLSSCWLKGTLFADPMNATRLLALIPGDALGRADVPIALGVNGCDNRAQCALLTKWVKATHPGPVQVVNDSELFGPAAGLTRSISVVCGTGSIVVGRDGQGELVKVGGHGWILGDPGSAPSLVRESVAAILAAHDAGDPPGPLAYALMKHYGSPDPVQLGYDFTADLCITDWGALAPLVFEAADAGDALAAGVIEADGRQLAADVVALRAKGVDALDVVAAGGVITSQPRLEQAFSVALSLVAPTLRVHLLRESPVVGALALARALSHEPK
ncbi:MAG: hypothetical protein FWF36_02985 [Propionibacteriaceae bacterium]|nr:hypothetical protein [Propionibacteriaceae bacterium]